MSDLINQLRGIYNIFNKEERMVRPQYALDAADRIEELERENAELRESIKRIHQDISNGHMVVDHNSSDVIGYVCPHKLLDELEVLGNEQDKEGQQTPRL